MSHLPDDLLPELRRIVSAALDNPFTIESVRSIGGGSISSSCLVTLDDGSTVFAKFGPLDFASLYECEAEGLESLQAVGEIAIPKVLGLGKSASHAVLVIEAVQQANHPEFFERFGRALALHHQSSQRKEALQWGWHRENFIGSTRQPNAWTDSWIDFVAEQRIGYQLSLASDKAVASRELVHLGDTIVDRMSELIGEGSEDPVLLHGDLWSGNYLCDDEGNPVLIDPAVYYGHREAEFGMIRLFGSCPEGFYEAYQDAWPLEDGWMRRSEVYRLYHLLNHLNLFGSGYLSGCISCAKGLLSA